MSIRRKIAVAFIALGLAAGIGAASATTGATAHASPPATWMRG